MKKIESVTKMDLTKKLLLLGIILIFFVSCAPDIIVQPPNSLRGYYVGRFYVTKNNSSQAGKITSYANIEWSFSDYGHTGNTSKAENEDLNLCSFTGAYTVENVITFAGTMKSAIEVCDDEFMPTEEFSVRWIYGDGGVDTLILQQFDSQADIFYEAKIEKQPDISD